jgi:hypothetical protein
MDAVHIGNIHTDGIENLMVEHKISSSWLETLFNVPTNCRQVLGLFSLVQSNQGIDWETATSATTTSQEIFS